MKATVCTLFEGHYHYGVAALVNSLHAQGFRGTVWAGYRGALPEWAGGGPARVVGDGLTIQFVPLTTDAHFTNYKAAFALEVLERLDPAAGGVFYFDPDIVVTGRWSFFEEWIACGVALCEDSTSPMSETHPIRAAWRKFGAAHGLTLQSRGGQYVNGGFIGVARMHLPFLRTWSRVLELMRAEIGTATNFNWADKDRTYAFYRNDQDALNITIEADATPVSIVGKEGMGFGGGGYIMYHSLGAPKPWRKHFVWEALKGWPPTAADKAFLAASDGPVAALSGGELAAKRGSALIAGAICRLVRKGGW
jgi:hypothetical protein